MRNADRSGLMRWLPCLIWGRDYRADTLRADVLAGLTLTCMLVPVGIAYAQAAGLPPITGLYSTIVPPLLYALFGPSRILILGPDSALTAVILSILLMHAAGDPGRAVLLASGMAIVSGLVLIGAGIARLGFVADLLSKPIRFGYLNGIALTMVVSQLPLLLGISVGDGSALGQTLRFAGAIVGAGWHGPTAALGVGAVILLLLMRRWRRIPAVLLVVLAATLLVGALQLDQRAVAVVGVVPRGLPALVLPVPNWADLWPVVAGGVAVALVSFADTSVLSRTFAARGGTNVDTNQEMIGLGAANLATGLLQGFPVSSSSTRTPVAEAAGARTPLAGVFAALGVGAVLLAGPEMLAHVPRAVLAAVVIGAAISLAEIGAVQRILRLDRVEGVLSLLCTAGVLLFGVLPGIGVAVALSVLAFLWRSWRPHEAVLGLVPDGGYHDVSRHPEARQVPGLILFRWDAPLFFANAELFVERVEALVRQASMPVRRFVLAAEPVTNIDLTAADALDALATRLAAAGVELCVAEMKGPVKDHLRQLGLYDRLGAERFHRSLEQAVGAYLALHPEARTAEVSSGRSSAPSASDGPSEGVEAR